MKKKVKIFIVILLMIILFVPFKTCYKDGGTIKYSAVMYGVTKQHSITEQDGALGYDVGTKVRILFFEVYNDVKFAHLESPGYD